MAFETGSDRGYIPFSSVSISALTVTVKYQSVTPGPCTGTLVITGDITNTPIEVPLSGEGIFDDVVPVTQKDYDTDLKGILLDQYKTRS
jgi:hypothetical protein